EAGAVSAHASPFADGVRRAGKSAEPARGYRLRGVGTCELEPGVDWFTPASCGVAATELPEHFWTAASLKRADSSTAMAAIVPGPAGGTLWLRLGAAPPIAVRGVGAQLALATLDRGEVVVTSDPVEPGEPDAVVVRALAPAAAVLHRVERLPGQVRALATGDVDGDGQPELIAAVRDDAARKTELWIIR